MIIYASACVISMFITWFVRHVKHKQEGLKYWLIITSLSASPLILVAAIRYNVGTDYFSYYNYYIGFLYGGNEQGRFEPLYYLLNTILGHLGAHPAIFFGACAIMFLLPVYYQIFRESPYPTLSVFLLFGTICYFFFLNGMRQMMAVAFLMMALPFAWKRQPKSFVIFTLIATGIHYSSLFFLIVYPLLGIRWNLKKICFCAIITIITLYVLGSMFTAIIQSIDIYSGYLDSTFNDGKMLSRIDLAVNGIILILGTIFYPKQNRKYQAYYLMSFITIFAYLLTSSVVLIGRVAKIFTYFTIIFVPLIIEQIPNKKLRLLILVAVITLYCIFAYRVIVLFGNQEVLPYQTIFDYPVL